jgi:GNAT superfamily N-acetyltransferase
MILVRKAEKRDLNALADLHRGEGWCYDDEVVLNDYWDDAFDKESIIVAEMDSRVVGTIELAKAYKSRFGFFGVLRRFVVSPSYRGTGIGRTLLKFALEEANRMGCNAVELSVDPDNSKPHKFYESQGFKDDRTEIVMVKPLTNKNNSSKCACL